VSPQFHVKVDEGFYSLQQERLESTWQAKTYFGTAQQTKPARQSTSSRISRKRKSASEGGRVRFKPTASNPEGATTSISEGAPNSEGADVTNIAPVNEARTESQVHIPPNNVDMADQSHQQSSNDQPPQPAMDTGDSSRQQNDSHDLR
jgi:hypothetical protein